MEQQKMGLPVQHVSDTAWLLALFRAIESEREDRHFNDHLAKKLVEDREQELLELFPDTGIGTWLMAIRTRVMDDLIYHFIKMGMNTIINLAAGLDTRPYRLAVPQSLRWIEIDLPGITQYKNSTLAKEIPNCELIRIATDLRDCEQTQTVFSQIATPKTKALVLTEGLLGYLQTSQVIQLAKDLYSKKYIYEWMTDIITPQFYIWVNQHTNQSLLKGPVHFHFMPQEGAEFFKPFGWKIAEFYSLEKESIRLNRMPVHSKKPMTSSLQLLQNSGIAVFSKKF